MRNFLFLAVGLLALLSSCDAKPKTDAASLEPAAAKPAYGSFGADTSQMETSVKPGDDFYKYVNGKWLAATKIPADKSGFSSGAIVNDKAEADVEQKRERWKRGVSLVDASIGEGLSQAYVQKFFPPENKAKMDALVANLRAALKSRIEKLDWMDEPTRTEALKKLATFEPRVGYPDKWRDYSGLTIEPGKLFEDVEAARKFDWQRQVKRLRQPVDRSEWAMTPYSVDAYYDSSMNQITFPAGILQPPFFDPAADPAVNYGAVGAIIGHEIGHGFDDQGREYDEKGKDPKLVDA